LTAHLKENGFSGAVICSVATVPAQVESINDFIAKSAAESHEYFTGFCTLHPDMKADEIDGEINRAVSMGLKGVKLHPDFQEFNADGKRACKLFEVIGARLPVLLHAGDKRFDFSSPKRIAAVMERFPDITVIAAHLGGWDEWDDSLAYLARRFGQRLYVDTASSLYAISEQKAAEYINAFGEDNVMFGTDYPMWDVKEELEKFDKLGLSDSARAKILYENAHKLLNL
jgi:predicted TIM-barrel fold metal-dependent hydrolase